MPQTRASMLLSCLLLLLSVSCGLISVTNLPECKVVAAGDRRENILVQITASLVTPIFSARHEGQMQHVQVMRRQQPGHKVGGGVENGWHRLRR
ncbi:hypothetical protein GQ54DRAFT_148843 [Martensiomyces pterosporus]|nr:hypothetical protein GQ54DRAFT_148843 [Martensiomyces pterosporus]